MNRWLARRIAEAVSSDETAVERMFSYGFLSAGGQSTHLKVELLDEVVVEIMILSETYPDGPTKRAFLLDQGEHYGELFARVIERGEEWALSEDLGWHVSVLMRHGVGARR